MFALSAPKIMLLVGAFVAGASTAIYFEEGRIGRLNVELGEYKSAYASLAETTAVQNQAIADLERAAQERAKIAKAATDAAKKEAEAARDRAASLLAERPPEGTDLCSAAREAFRQELIEERSE